ncbi:hypothetical protein GCM10027058_08290 [Microbacterium neimengense]
MLVIVVAVKGMTVRVVDVVDMVAVHDRLVSASFAVFVRLGGVMLVVGLRSHS